MASSLSVLETVVQARMTSPNKLPLPNDAAQTISHVVENNLQGIYSVVDNRETPRTNKVLFDKLAAEAGVAQLEF